jgi:hypothetical protein
MITSLLGMHKDSQSRQLSQTPMKALKRKSRRFHRKRKGDASTETEVGDVVKQPSLSFAFSDESISVCETAQGVELALDLNASGEKTLNLDLLHYMHFVKQASKTNLCQFSTKYPLLSTKPKSHYKKNFSSTHRIPLGHPKSTASLEDDLSLLQSHAVRDELTSVEEEMNKLKAEIQSVEDDRMDLEHEYLKIPNLSIDLPFWDPDCYLKFMSPKSEEYQELLRLRGNSFTVHIQSAKTLESLYSKLSTSNSASNINDMRWKSAKTILADTLVAHLCLHPGSRSSSAFFLRTDNAVSLGYIPPLLFSRMKKHNFQRQEVTYLSVGPNGNYFCNFSSGHVWWGIGDPDFHALAQDWNIHRVAFGESKKFKRQKRLSSWIIVGRDGRVAFKNLPKRLANLLCSRLADQAAPAEISLGSDGAYFVRFLDGSIDYCLPSSIADVCHEIQGRGGTITNVLLHPQLPKQFIIRHTNLKVTN